MTIKVKQPVVFRDLGKMGYRQAWDYQETLLQENVQVKTELRNRMSVREDSFGETSSDIPHPVSDIPHPETRHYLLFVEHPPVFTLGKSGSLNNLLIGEEQLQENGIEFFNTNRGGDITFHGTDQIVGYPILDLEKFYTDIGKYLRDLEEVIIRTMSEYGLRGERSAGETGVWIDTGIPGRERKICAMGIRCSRWITMHGFALNVNTDLSYFNHIIPCGIQHKQVTSLQKELGRELSMEEVKQKVKQNFEQVFQVELVKEEN